MTAFWDKKNRSRSDEEQLLYLAVQRSQFWKAKFDDFIKGGNALATNMEKIAELEDLGHTVKFFLLRCCLPGESSETMNWIPVDPERDKLGTNGDKGSHHLSANIASTARSALKTSCPLFCFVFSCLPSPFPSFIEVFLLAEKN